MASNDLPQRQPGASGAGQPQPTPIRKPDVQMVQVGKNPKK